MGIREMREIFFFNGVQRLQFGFDTPNCCAAFFVPLLMVLCIPLDFSLQGRRTLGKLAIAFSAAVAAIVLSTIVAMTYSRGGYVAVFAGLALACFMRRSAAPILMAIVFIAVLLFVPEADERFCDIGDIAEASVENRITLWKGACAIIAEFPFKGLANAAEYNMAICQPLTVKGHYYATFMNDWLNIACYHGLPIATLAYSCLFFPIIGAGVLSFRKNISEICKTFMSYMVVTVFSYAVLSQFSCFYALPSVITLPLVVFAFLSICIIILYVKEKCQRQLALLILVSGIGGVMASMSVYAYGRSILNERKFTVEKIDIPKGDNMNFIYCKGAGHTLLIVTQEQSSTLSPNPSVMESAFPQGVANVRDYLRPCAEASFNAMHVHLPYKDMDDDSLLGMLNGLLERNGIVNPVIVADARTAARLVRLVRLRHDEGIFSMPRIPMVLFIDIISIDDAESLESIFGTRVLPVASDPLKCASMNAVAVEPSGMAHGIGPLLIAAVREFAGGQ